MRFSRSLFSLLSVLLWLSVSMPAGGQTWSEGDLQINRKRATAGFDASELTFGSGLSVAYNGTSKTVTVTASGGGGGGGTWGSITGTLSDQTDLQTALNAKLNSSAVSAFGLTLIDDADASAARTTLGLGTLATQNGTLSDYLTTATAASTYVSLSGSYSNPAWITGLAWSKITGAPSFLTANQTITLSGAVTGSGTTAITTTLAANQARDNLTGGSGTLNLSAFTLTLPSDVTRLGSSIDLSGAEVTGSLPWASVSGAPSFITGASPTITTPTISGAITFPDGVSQTFNPDGTNAGLNVGAHTADPSSPSNGDLFYNSTSNALRARINGAWVSLGAGGGGGIGGSVGTVDNTIPRADGTGGSTLQGSLATVNDLGLVESPQGFSAALAVADPNNHFRTQLQIGQLLFEWADGLSDIYSGALTAPIGSAGGWTWTLPSATGTLLTSDGNGSALTNLNASNLSSGTVATARLGSGTANSSTFLRGDGTWTTPAGAGTVTSVGGTGTVNGITLTGTVTSSGNLTLGGTLSGVDLTSAVTGALPIANGGTGQTTAVAAFDALAPTTTKGDLIVHNGTDNIRVAVGATNGHVLTVDSTTAEGVKWAAGGGGGGSTDVRLYTANDTWTNPSPSTAKRVFVRLVGGGGGGGSGRKGAAGTVRCGGGGGGAGSVVEFWALTTELSSTSAVTVGAGGTGGAAVAVNNTNGANGVAGGFSEFASTRAIGGGNGSGGTAAAGAAGAGGANIIGLTAVTGSSGAAASGTGTAGGAAGVVSVWMPSGAGAGGGITTANTASAGGAGGGMGAWNTVLEIAGGTAGGIGANGGAGVSARGSGTGGGGGGSSVSAAAGNGGPGGLGAGGGGGGASTNDVGNSGAGGNGGNGYVLIITY